MGINSVYDFSSFINCQIQLQQRLDECLGQLDALMTIAVTTNDFYEAPKNILHNYLSVASDLIDTAFQTNNESLNALLKYTL